MKDFNKPLWKWESLPWCFWRLFIPRLLEFCFVYTHWKRRRAKSQKKVLVCLQLCWLNQSILEQFGNFHQISWLQPLWWWWGRHNRMCLWVCVCGKCTTQGLLFLHFHFRNRGLCTRNQRNTNQKTFLSIHVNDKGSWQVCFFLFPFRILLFK